MEKGKVVRSLSAYEATIKRFDQFRIIHPLPSDAAVLARLGFEAIPSEGDALLPSAIGKISEFNSNGKQITRKDLPKQTESRMSWRTWKDWHGNTHSGVQMRKVEVYPRELVAPPSEYLFVLTGQHGLMLCSRELSIKADGEGCIIHVVNLFLELFGKFEITDSKLNPNTGVQVKKLNWRIFPPGVYPFIKAKEALSTFMMGLNEKDRPVVEERIKIVTSHSPDFLAVGIGGFKDYVVFGFTSKGKYVLESPALGNATYIFTNNWQELSAMTKKQILDGSLHEARIIHNNKWRSSLREILARKDS